MKIKKYIIFFLITLFALVVTKANNVSIGNVNIIPATGIDTAKLSFEVSWEQSWKTNNSPNNHDAIWVFVKRRLGCSSGSWTHVRLSHLATRHEVGAPLEVFIDGKDPSYTTAGVTGVFLRRISAGTGNIINVPIVLEMRNIPLGEFDYKIFAIEMVYIPTSRFYIGDGSPQCGGAPCTYYKFTSGNTENPLLITSDGALTAGTALGQIYSSSTNRPVNIPVAFPLGYDSIYCMKYEISQNQYVNFLNLLDDNGAATTRAYIGLANRNNINGVWPSYSSSTPDRANNWMNWYDLLAYLDWAALRPMTETEDEKICRGPAIPIINEFAWGNSLIVEAKTLVAGTDGQPNESVQEIAQVGQGIANYNNNSIIGPLRCGFAAQISTNRLQAGATYYGVLEMSGNLREGTVSTVNGTAFTGVVGDGIITSAGFANQANWPSTNTTETGVCLRGGGTDNTAEHLRISSRYYCTPTWTNASTRDLARGGRGVR